MVFATESVCTIYLIFKSDQISFHSYFCRQTYFITRINQRSKEVLTGISNCSCRNWTQGGIEAIYFSQFDHRKLYSNVLRVTWCNAVLKDVLNLTPNQSNRVHASFSTFVSMNVILNVCVSLCALVPTSMFRFSYSLQFYVLHNVILLLCVYKVNGIFCCQQIVLLDLL